jgi:hypothetical protein
MSYVCSCHYKRRLAEIGLSNEIIRLRYKDGRVTLGQRLMPQDSEA